MNFTIRKGEKKLITDIYHNDIRVREKMIEDNLAQNIWLRQELKELRKDLIRLNA